MRWNEVLDFTIDGINTRNGGRETEKELSIKILNSRTIGCYFWNFLWRA